MEAATGEDSEAGLERAEVVLLEADFAASTALDMLFVEWRLGTWVCELKGEENEGDCRRDCWASSPIGRDWLGSVFVSAGIRCQHSLVFSCLFR